MGKARWKVVSAKKLSARARGLKRFKIYSCMFTDKVLCSYRKDDEATILDRCFRCSHYKRFKDKMDEEDEAENREVEEVFRRGRNSESRPDSEPFPIGNWSKIRDS